VDVKVSVVRAMARAGAHLVPSARTVLDVGAEEARAVRCDERGNALDFALNDRCAAGAGSFIEAMSRALDATPEEMGALALRAAKAAAMNSQCVIFAESEVVSMIHRRIPREEIARSAYEAMAGRIAPLLRKTGISPDVVLVGGVANDRGFLDALRRSLNLDVIVPPHPEYAGALGAALCVA
jgi:benzoyl-CoA reductase subunit D